MQTQARPDLAPEALRRVSISRAQVTRALPYYARIALGLRPKLVDGLGTVAVTPDLQLLIDPAVVGAQWPEGVIPGAFLHETLHVALRHLPRANVMREGQGDAFDGHNWNLAADMECNRIVQAIGLPLPDGAVFAATYGFPANILAEDAYHRLCAMPKQDDKNGKDGKDGDGKPGKFAAGKCGGCAGNPVAGEHEHADPQGGASPLERESIEQAVAEAIVDAAAKSPGSVPAEVLRQAQARVAASETPWQAILSRHLRRATQRRRGTRDWTFARPHRRQATLGGVDAPLRPTTYDPLVECAVVVDTSGSMGEAEIQLALTEIDGLLRASGSNVLVLSCDAKVHATGKVARAADAAKLIKGGGGTDFRPAFAALEKVRPAVTVVVTDGYGPAPATAPVWTDTIWVLVGSMTTRPCSWGEVVEVK